MQINIRNYYRESPKAITNSEKENFCSTIISDIYNKMKKTFNVTIAITVESEAEIEDINDIDFDVEVKSKDAKIKIIDIPESYEVYT